MERLPRQQWHSALEGIITEEIPFVVVCMHYQRAKVGSIWVDDPKTPKTVVARFPKDAFFRGDPADADVRDLLQGFKGTMADPPGLEELLTRGGFRFEKIPSLKYRHTGARARPRTPGGCTVEAISRNNVHLLRDFWGEEYIHDFYDFEDFMDNSFGAIAVHEGKCVAACAAISVSAKRFDNGLDTAEGHRCKGLATACALSTLSQGLDRGKEPVWITEADNAASRRVAIKAGYEIEYDFTVYNVL
jgi:hypothetical protein